MRTDMAKILVERPRPRSRVLRGRDGRKYRDASEASFLPMKAGYQDLKSLNENLHPLQRYLARQVNRPWDHVFREICAVIDGRSAVQRHILQHLHQHVAIQTRRVGGTLLDCGEGLFGPGPVWQPMYVDPRTGLLRLNVADALHSRRSRERQRAAERGLAARWRELSPTQQLHRLGGQWFLVELAALPRAPESAWDAVRRCRVARGPGGTRLSVEEREAQQCFGRPDIYAASKRQLSSREMRDYGLLLE